MIAVKGGVTAPKGFLASGAAAGIKISGKKDLALLYSEVPAVAAAAFTTNRFQASPVKVSKIHLKNKTHQAIIVNSGNANCANGNIGDRDAVKMAEFTGKALLLDKKAVLIASTGIIGRNLPLKKIESAIPDLVADLSAARSGAFADAILTTDTCRKELAVKVRLGAGELTIGGSCKGVGMIYPVMKTERHATMLCFLTTDASIKKQLLAEALDEALGSSFNMISVDGAMSTNDACFILANGLSGAGKIKHKGNDYYKFAAALEFLCKELAKKIARDGEGATKFVDITVCGAKNLDAAKVIARKISTSSLLKCCIHGEDPNWGRVIAAAGSSGIDFDQDKVDVYLGRIKVLSKGESVKNFDKPRARKLFKKRDIYIKVDLNDGRMSASAWTCDFSKEYVEINSAYST